MRRVMGGVMLIEGGLPAAGAGAMIRAGVRACDQRLIERGASLRVLCCALYAFCASRV